MKKIIISLTLLLSLPLFLLAGDGFTIRGKVSGIISGSARINVIDMDGNEKGKHLLPEKIRIVNGEFLLTGKLDHPVRCMLNISTKTITVFLENTDYTIDAAFSDLTASSVKGGEYHPLYVAYYAKPPQPDVYIKENSGTAFAAWVAYWFGRESNVNAIEYYKLLAPAAQASYYGKALHTHNLEKANGALTGKPIPVVTLTDPDAKTFTLQQFSGHYVVVDFWASWCGPCRAYIPKLKALYEKYAVKGVKFLSISVDDSIEKWQKAMFEEKMPWQQGLGAGGFSDQGLKKVFGFSSIPYLVIMGPDGKIAAELDFFQKEKLEETIMRLIEKK